MIDMLTKLSAHMGIELHIDDDEKSDDSEAEDKTEA